MPVSFLTILLFMKKLLFVVSICVLALVVFPEQAYAQRGTDYQTSAGLRLSPFYGASVKHFIQSNHALEGILHSSWDALKITGLYEIHTPAFDEPGLQFYYGGGAHLGFTGRRYLGRWHDGYDRGTYGLVGIDGIIGVEYTIQEPDIPLNVSLDWKPTFDFAPEPWFRGSELAITVRYIFNR